MKDNITVVATTTFTRLSVDVVFAVIVSICPSVLKVFERRVPPRKTLVRWAIAFVAREAEIAAAYPCDSDQSFRIRDIGRRRRRSVRE
jgi:hypothetical protein